MKFKMKLNDHSAGQVLLDDIDISNAVYGVSIEAKVDETPRITLKLAQAVEVEIDNGIIHLEYPTHGRKVFKGRAK